MELAPRLLAAAGLLLGVSVAQGVGVPQGVEFGCAPFCTCDVVGSGDGRDFVSAYNTSVKVPVDARGWPRADFYAVIFDNREGTGARPKGCTLDARHWHIVTPRELRYLPRAPGRPCVRVGAAAG